MKISVKVPATSANIGPGLDCMGLALPIYNIITVEETVLPGSGIAINVVSNDLDDLSYDEIPLDKSSIIYKAIEVLYNSIGQTPHDLRITVNTSIPLTRGLGSSSSVVVGGLLAANELLGRPADEAALLSIAAELEGHPDNVTPAIVGGLVMASQEDDGRVIYSRLEWPDEWQITVCIPNFELSTDIARSVLPKEVPMKDAIFNVQRVGLFIDAVCKRDTELMKIALKDRLHQPYRMKLVPGLQEIMGALRHEENVLGCVLSGAGPSILVFSHKNGLDKIKSIVRDTWNDFNVKVDIRTLPIEKTGAVIINKDE
jgi:homoserine kinase